MPVDERRISELRRFRDPGGAFQEEFLQPEVGGSRVLATLTRPTREARPIGWVVCHSFGIEQIHLGRLEVNVARDLATAGFPVLRYSGRGYGDSEGSTWDVTLTTHLEDATRMVEVLRREAGVEAVGLLGARFGGLVAGIVADRAEAECYGAWEPILDGRRYIDQQLRYGAMSAIVGKKATHRPVKEIKEAMAVQGWADLGGHALTKRCYDELVEVGLIDSMPRFAGDAHFVSVTTTGEPTSELRTLVESLRSHGAACQLVALKHLTGFGRFRYGDGQADTVKVDTLHDLTTRISAETLAWCDSIS